MAGTRKSSGRSAAVAAAARGARSAAVAGGVDVFGYLDYRAYLRDVYVAKKAEGRASATARSRSAPASSRPTSSSW